MYEEKMRVHSPRGGGVFHAEGGGAPVNAPIPKDGAIYQQQERIVL